MTNVQNKVVLSVIVPTFRRARLLFPTLVCLSHQTLSPGEYEVLVVDSGDDSETPALFKRHFSAHPFRYVSMATSQNRSQLRNQGASLACGNVLVFLDNDIMVPQDFVEKHLLAHEQKSPQFYLTARKRLDEFDPRKFPPEWLINHFELLDRLPAQPDERVKYLSEDSPGSAMIAPWRLVYSHSLSMTRSTFDDLQGFDESFGEHWGWEDIELGLRACERGIGLTMDHSVTSYHQPHPRSDGADRTINERLALSRHPWLDVELYAYLDIRFSYYYDRLLPLVDDYQNEVFPGDFPLGTIVVGCLQVRGQVRRDNAFLGIHFIQFAPKEVPLAIVHPTFLKFDRTIQLDILEATCVVARALRFPTLDVAWISATLLMVGYGGEIAPAEDGWTEVKLVAVGANKRWLVVLPHPDQGSDRRLLEAVALTLRRFDQEVHLIDRWGYGHHAATDPQQTLYYFPLARRRTICLEAEHESLGSSGLAAPTAYIDQGLQVLNRTRNAPRSVSVGYDATRFQPLPRNTSSDRIRFVCFVSARYWETDWEALELVVQTLAKSRHPSHLSLLVDTDVVHLRVLQEVTRRYRLLEKVTWLRRPMDSTRQALGSSFDVGIILSIYRRWDSSPLEALASGLRVLCPSESVPEKIRDCPGLVTFDTRRNPFPWQPSGLSVYDTVGWETLKADSDSLIAGLQNALRLGERDPHEVELTAQSLARDFDWQVLLRELLRNTGGAVV